MSLTLEANSAALGRRAVRNSVLAYIKPLPRAAEASAVWLSHSIRHDLD